MKALKKFLPELTIISLSASVFALEISKTVSSFIA